MAKPPKNRDQRQDAPDVNPDAWERFEHAVDVVAKSKPRPKMKPDRKPTGNKGESPKKVSRNRRTARLLNPK